VRKRTQKQTQTTDIDTIDTIDTNNCSFHTQRSQVFTELVTHTSDLMIVLREDFRMVDANLAASQHLELSTEEVMGKTGQTGQAGHDCRTILGCQNLNRMVLCGTSSCPLVRAQRQGSLPNEELILGTDPEHSYEVSASITPVTIDDTFYAIFTARDMSALKVINSVRSNFVSMISHELRTPLNSVHGFIDLLLQGHMGAMTDEQHTYLGYTQEGVQQLIAIVEDILFMTRSDLGQFEVKQQEIHPLSLVHQVTRSLKPQATRAEVALYSTLSDDVPALSIDPQRIKQVLSNLVANAIKFTPPGGTVTISSRRHDEHFEMISVEDTGYGIPPEDRQHVFERFYQSNHSQQSKMGGYGLGLAIAKLIVEQHGGTIGFDTVINKGTTFYFTVPLFVQRQST